MTIAQTSRSRLLVPESALPDRYQTQLRPAFVAQVLRHCQPGTTILDVGGGSQPTLPRQVRPTGCTYIGVDPGVDDLGRGDYDARILADAAELQAELIGNVDLIVSFNVLEHVQEMPRALACFRSYLRPRGVLLAGFAGRWAAFAVASRVLPHRIRVQVLKRLIGATPDDHFPTHYDRCSARQLHRLLADWSEHEIIPYYVGAGYLSFSRTAQRAYLAYEAMAMRSPQLATHYNIKAVR